MASAASVSPVDEVAEFFAQAPTREQIVAFHFSVEAQERVRALLAGNAAGTLTPAEQRELDQLVVLDDVVSLIRARAQRDASSAA